MEAQLKIVDTSPDSIQAATSPKLPEGRIGDLLIQKGVLSKEQLKQALEVQRQTGAFLGQVLTDLGFVTPEAIGELLAQISRVRYVDLSQVHPQPEVVALLPEEMIRLSQVLPLRLHADILEVAMVDPLDVATIDRIHDITGRRVRPFLTMVSELNRLVNELFDAGKRTSAALQELNQNGDNYETDEERARRVRAEMAAVSEAPIVRLVDSVLESAVSQRASDIHFEPQDRFLRIRLRVDGHLNTHADVPRSQQAAILARIKVLCQMDITEARRPQDGRLAYDYHGRIYDLRVSSVPTVNGEKIVLRILDKSAILVPLANLGFHSDQLAQVETLIHQPHGMIVVVGPTGSGKSTTLYAAMNMLNDNTRNIMTLEDPVEYYVPGLNQIQANPRLGLTFAAGLRAFVRQDPDVILVGEIRDLETAEMAMQASLTGHLLLSTLHTNTAVGTITRLTNLGLDPFLVAQSLSGVISQRLIARVCSQCAVPYEPAPDVLRGVRIAPEQTVDWTFRRGMGCRQCSGRGYRGRVGIFEVLTICDELRHLIIRGAPEAELHAAAVQDGMKSLWLSAAEAVRQGITTLEEMGRAVLEK